MSQVRCSVCGLTDDTVTVNGVPDQYPQDWRTVMVLGTPTHSYLLCPDCFTPVQKALDK